MNAQRGIHAGHKHAWCFKKQALDIWFHSALPMNRRNILILFAILHVKSRFPCCTQPTFLLEGLVLNSSQLSILNSRDRKSSFSSRVYTSIVSSIVCIRQATAMSANTPSTSPSGLLALSTVVPSICVAIVALRFELRRTQKSPIKADDWIMLPALVSRSFFRHSALSTGNMQEYITIFAECMLIHVLSHRCCSSACVYVQYLVRYYPRTPQSKS